ncbi:hypothetical protein ACFVJS_15795 [Nocardioides sp. NPDC057772]|uniref:hypothetical protein n=1 Tax=Nocardioides sp. NPDC057772 TaxID=3346245 RepID=UPI0002028C99|nr:hypothetical protein NBCG_02967 [Nocardioidaceae bacterium Broad-1]
MTYAESGAAIRDGLTNLLRQQRVQFRLGGSGVPALPVETTDAERRDAGAQIRRFRQTVLTWCHQAAIAGDPEADDPFLDHDRGSRTRRPYDRFRIELRRVISASTSDLPTLEELSTPQDLPLVESWRQVAKGATLGEHDFFAGLESGALSIQQGQTLLKDAAAVVQAVLMLDRRYMSTPGWQHIPSPGRLAWATMATALEASLDPPDYTVDIRGWRPAASLVRGPAKPGLLGVLQAEHNLLVRLKALPSPINLKKVVQSQRLISAALADITPSPALATRWTRRATTHELVFNELRNVAGRVGDGIHAAQEAANIRLRLDALPEYLRSEMPERDSPIWTAFDSRFEKIDARLADIIEAGIADKTLLRRAHVPRLEETSPELVKPVRVRFAPIAGQRGTDLATVVRERLRPAPATPAAPPEAATSRAELFSAITSRAAASAPNSASIR